VLPLFNLKSLDSRLRRNDKPKTASCMNIMSRKNIMPREKPSAHPSHSGTSSVDPIFIVTPASIITPAKAGVQELSRKCSIRDRSPVSLLFAVSSFFRHTGAGRYPALPPFILKSLDSRLRGNDEPKPLRA
jgi:hypothetical protein